MVTLRLERHMGRVEWVMCQVPVRKVRGGGVKRGEAGEEGEVEERRVGERMRGMEGGIVVDGGGKGGEEVVEEMVGSLFGIVDGSLWRRTLKVLGVSGLG